MIDPRIGSKAVLSDGGVPGDHAATLMVAARVRSERVTAATLEVVALASATVARAKAARAEAARAEALREGGGIASDSGVAGDERRCGEADGSGEPGGSVRARTMDLGGGDGDNRKSDLGAQHVAQE